MNPIEHPLVAKLTAAWPNERRCNLRTIVAVSGGPDSVAMLHALVKSNRQTPSASDQLIVTHVDHGVRAESAADAEFVVELANRLGLASEVFAPDAGQARSSAQSEESLRAYRYQCLTQAAEKHGARYLATAHTQDDQIETILFRILRGTGVRGLTGIPVSRLLTSGLTLVRPMLGVTRTEVMQFLQEIDADHRVDDSNRQSHYTRNFLRNELLPLARKRFPDVDQALVNLSRQAIDQQAASSNWIAIAKESIVATDHTIEIACKPIKHFPPATLIDALIEAWEERSWPRGDMKQGTWQKVAALIQSKESNPPAINLPGNVRAERIDDRVALTKS